MFLRPCQYFNPLSIICSIETNGEFRPMSLQSTSPGLCHGECHRRTIWFSLFHDPFSNLYHVRAHRAETSQPLTFLLKAIKRNSYCNILWYSVTFAQRALQLRIREALEPLPASKMCVAVATWTVCQVLNCTLVTAHWPPTSVCDASANRNVPCPAKPPLTSCRKMLRRMEDPDEEWKGQR